jgi:hypothetical protein
MKFTLNIPVSTFQIRCKYTGQPMTYDVIGEKTYKTKKVFGKEHTEEVIDWSEMKTYHNMHINGGRLLIEEDYERELGVKKKDLISALTKLETDKKLVVDLLLTALVSTLDSHKRIQHKKVYSFNFNTEDNGEEEKNGGDNNSTSSTDIQTK